MAALSQATRIVLAPDCGPGVGSGHVERALALREELPPSAEVVVALPQYEPALRRAAARGARVLSSPEGMEAALLDAVQSVHPHVVVLDGYQFPVALQKALRRAARLAIVDDLSQDCDADLLVNPAPGGELYPRPPGAAELLAGAAFAIMSRPYLEARERRSRRPGAAANRVLVVNGSADVGRALAGIACSLLRHVGGAPVDVVEGAEAEPMGELPGATTHHAPSDLSRLMEYAAVYVGAAGTSAVQAAAVGVPLVVTPVVANQVDQAKALKGAGAAVVVELAEGVDALAERAAALLDDPALRRQMSKCGAAKIDARGATRVAAAVLGLVTS